jgi:hypothetical protein
MRERSHRHLVGGAFASFIVCVVLAGIVGYMLATTLHSHGDCTPKVRFYA